MFAFGCGGSNSGNKGSGGALGTGGNAIPAGGGNTGPGAAGQGGNSGSGGEGVGGALSTGGNADIGGVTSATGGKVGSGGNPATGGSGGSMTGGSGGRATGGAAGSGPGGAGGTPAGALAVWTSDAGTKIQPTTAAATTTSITLATYRDAYVSAQIAVQGKVGHLEGVTLSMAGDLSDGAGHTLTKDNIAFFREFLIDFTHLPAGNVTGNSPVPTSSPTNDGNIPDPLIPLVDPYTGANAGQPFNVAENTNQPVFVDVHVPKGLTAGTYTGTINVASTVGGSATVPISVTAWNLDLPDMRTVTTHFKMSINNLDYYHAGLDVNGYENFGVGKGATVLQRYEDLAHAHRIDVGQGNVQAPSNGCTPPAASDFAAYDTAMAHYMDGSYFTDGVPSSRFDIPLSPGQTFGTATTTSCAGANPACTKACSQSQYVAVAKAWSDHLTANNWFPNPATDGWFGPVIYAYDEPLAAGGGVAVTTTLLNNIASDCQWIESSNAGWKAHIIDTVAPIDNPPSGGVATQPILTPVLGVYVVALVLYDNFWQHGPFYGRADWPTLFAKGTQMWFYEGNSIAPPYPTFATDTLDGNEPVIMMWASWRENATGFLFWDIADWAPANDPWGYEISFGKTGDGVMIYPGNHAGSLAPAGSPTDVAIDGPIPSYRLKRLRQGLQDWALFRYADSKGLTAFVQQQVDTVYKQLGAAASAPEGTYWTSTDSSLLAIRSAVVAKVLGP